VSDEPRPDRNRNTDPEGTPIDIATVLHDIRALRMSLADDLSAAAAAIDLDRGDVEDVAGDVACRDLTALNRRVVAASREGRG
jgi:hypothetical protein